MAPAYLLWSISVVCVAVRQSSSESPLSDTIRSGLTEALYAFEQLTYGEVLTVLGESQLSPMIRRYLHSTVLFYTATSNRELTERNHADLRGLFARARGLLLEETPLFHELKTDISWSDPATIDLSQMHASIVSLNTALEATLTPGPRQLNARAGFSRRFAKEGLRHRLYALANEVLRGSGENRTNPLYVALDTIRNDRVSLHIQLSGIAQIVLASVQFEVAHKHFSSLDPYDSVDVWAGWARDFTNVVYNLDALVRARAVAQLGADILAHCERFEHEGRSDDDLFVRWLYLHIKFKFYWRTWCVLAFHDDGATKFAVGARNGYVHKRCAGRNVVVGNAKRLKHDEEQLFDRLAAEERFDALNSAPGVSLAEPKQLLTRYQSMMSEQGSEEGDAQLVMFVYPGRNLLYHAYTDRVVHKKLSRGSSESVNAFAFG